MMHSPSHPSWLPARIRERDVASRDRMKLAISTLAISLLFVAAVVWLIAAYL